MSTDAREFRIDVPTVLAISALAYTLANLVHEGLGHGGTCVLVGAHPTMLNAIFFEYDERSVTLAQQRWISAGGSIVNVLVGLPIVWVLHRARWPASLRYFAWLFAAVNLLTAFGYLLFSGIGGIGDWARVVEGWGKPWAWRGGMALVGAILYFLVAPRLLMPLLDPFLGTEAVMRVKRARTLGLLPYVAGSVALAVAGLFNPYGFRVVLISAIAAGFGGTSLLAWYPSLPRAPAVGTPATPLAIDRSWGWIVTGVLVLVFFVFVLGRGIRIG